MQGTGEGGCASQHLPGGTPAGVSRELDIKNQQSDVQGQKDDGKVSSRGSSCKMQPGPRELGQKPERVLAGSARRLRPCWC